MGVFLRRTLGQIPHVLVSDEYEHGPSFKYRGDVPWSIKILAFGSAGERGDLGLSIVAAIVKTQLQLID